MKLIIMLQLFLKSFLITQVTDLGITYVLLGTCHSLPDSIEAKSIFDLRGGGGGGESSRVYVATINFPCNITLVNSL